MIRRSAKCVEAFADRAVAHADRRSSQPLPLDGLHTAVDALVRVHDVYAQALGSDALSDDRPPG
jgi:hypothetical protein